MPAYAFYQIDVFTTKPLGGNPLAVFPHPTGLDSKTMQALAREMNLSETTFVLPSECATRRVRFFTPTAEIPLAGHPTIGTWWTLAELGELTLPDQGVEEVSQETGAGVLPVYVHSEHGKPVRVVMVQAPPQFGPRLTDGLSLGTALGGGAKTVLLDPVPQIVSTALPQLMIPIRSLTDLEELPTGGSGSTLADLLSGVGTDCAMCYSTETVDSSATVHCRMFAPGLGVPEDPATGSAAGALGAYLVHNRVVEPREGVATIVVEQGIEIGRPSSIQVEISVAESGGIVEVRVGGKAITVIRGEVLL
jgi:trans-2,3-dihydro-3-hydroxyanthranilate isomerase